MIILDIETTGLDPKRNCMVSLGAVDYSSAEEFYEECSIYPHSKVDPIAMSVNGFKLEDIQPGEKQVPYIVYWNFLKWAQQFQSPLLLGGHNVGHFDVLFLEALHEEFPGSDPWPFGYRTVDLHSVAFAKFGESLSHEKICLKLGLPVEPKPHNALLGARSERDAFKLLLG